MQGAGRLGRRPRRIAGYQAQSGGQEGWPRGRRMHEGRRCFARTHHVTATLSHLRLLSSVVDKHLSTIRVPSSAHTMADRFASNIDALSKLLPPRLLAPRVGIVCGSGLSTLASSLREIVEVPYSALAGFATSTGAPCVLLDDTLLLSLFGAAWTHSSWS